MPNEYTPTPFDKRESETLGVADYAKHVSYFTGLPLAIGALGGIMGAAFKNKLPYLNGRAPLINRLTNRAMEKANNQDYSHVENAPHFAPMWNFVKASIPVSALITFQKWQRDEQRRFDIADVYADLQKIAPRVETQEKLEDDNWLLKKQVDFKREQVAANSIRLDGALKAPEGMGKV